MKAIISIYTYGDVPGPAFLSMCDLASYITQTKWPVVLRTIRDDALISRSRCRQTKFALESGMDVWLQIDHDLEFNPEDAFRLCEIAIEKQAAVCVPYPCRSLPIRSALRTNKHEALLEAAGKDEVHEIVYAASGFLAIPMSCLERTIEICSSMTEEDDVRIVQCLDPMVGEFPSLWKPMTPMVGGGKREYLSEDYSASFRMKKAGVPQLAWTKPILRHWGDYPYSIDGQYHG